MAEPKRHHYVPQFLLRQFLVGGDPRLHALDKKTLRVFRASVADVAAENRLYDLSIGGLTASFEPVLAAFDSEFAKAIAHLRALDNVRRITWSERLLLAQFAAHLHIRSPHFSLNWQDFVGQLRNRIRRIGGDLEAMPDLAIPTAADQKILTVQSLMEWVPGLAVHLLEKDCTLDATAGPKGLYVSDNPLTMHNMRPDDGRGRLGFGVRGVQLFLPLSPTRCLTWHCPSWRLLVERAAADGHTLDKVAQEYVAAVATGVPLQCSVDHVTFLNSLQVARSERFVYSSDGDFSLALSMLHDEPALRQGPRMEMA